MARLPMRADLDRLAAATIETGRLRATRPRSSRRAALVRQVKATLARQDGDRGSGRPA